MCKNVQRWEGKISQKSQVNQPNQGHQPWQSNSLGYTRGVPRVPLGTPLAAGRRGEYPPEGECPPQGDTHQLVIVKR